MQERVPKSTAEGMTFSGKWTVGGSHSGEVHTRCGCRRCKIFVKSISQAKGQIIKPKEE